MISVYVLESTRTKYRYVGITADLADRLERHNHGRSRATKPFAPFKLVLEEHFSNYFEARVREKFLKTGAGREYLDRLLS